MGDFEFNYLLKGRMSLDGDWYVLGSANTREGLDEMLDKYRPTWRYLAWNSYRARKTKK